MRCYGYDTLSHCKCWSTERRAHTLYVCAFLLLIIVNQQSDTYIWYLTLVYWTTRTSRPFYNRNVHFNHEGMYSSKDVPDQSSGRESSKSLQTWFTLGARKYQMITGFSPRTGKTYNNNFMLQFYEQEYNLPPYLHEILRSAPLPVLTREDLFAFNVLHII